MTPRIRLAIVGLGKMGRSVRELANASGFEVVAAIDAAAAAATGPAPAELNGAQVAIEFTVPSAAAVNVRACARAGVPVVSGTTGWDAERAAVEADVRASSGALLWAPNFAIGVHLFARIVSHAAAEIAAQAEMFDTHLIETHHAAKKDAPSGTAKLLAAKGRSALGKDIPITSVRTGHVPGTHEVIFDAPFEQIRLIHTARDRRVFASGALAAARWLAGRQGVFTLDDMLRPA